MEPLRKAQTDDLKAIMEIIKGSQKIMHEMGIDQWTNGYPGEDSILEDIRQSRCYVLVSEGKISAVEAICFDGEPTYSKIYQGSWKSSRSYAVIHRIASDPHLRRSGLGSCLLDAAQELAKSRGFHSLRADTHRDNIPMRNLLLKNGFTYCGIIYLASGAERLAFEKLF